MRQEPWAVDLRPWSEGDLPLLYKLMGDPEMTKHLGGPETAEQIEKRHRRYVALAGSGKGRMFTILAGPAKEAAGSVGYWETTWRDQLVYESGWIVLVAFQGRGIATRATAAAAAAAREERKHRFLHAFPAPANAASNAICKKLGFSLIEECDFEYPKGVFGRHNYWRLDLRGG